MKTPLLTVLPLLLIAGCSPGDSQPQQKAKETASAPAAAPKPPVPPKPGSHARMVKEENDLLEFTYGWPAEAAAIPALNARFENEMAELRKEAIETAQQDRSERGADIPFNGHYLSKVWDSLGDGPRLLSLAAEVATFTGGAHGNVGYDVVLWDRQSGKPIKVEDLFTDPKGALAVMTSVYCGELDKQRSEKRQEPLPLKGDEWMTGCRPLAEQTVAPVDTNKDGRFDLMRVQIEPYNSGPYAEGSYEVDIPLTPALRGMIKKDYAGDF